MHSIYEVCLFCFQEGFLKAWIKSGKPQKITKPELTNATYKVGLPIGNWLGGTKETVKANNTPNKPTPAMVFMPIFPPGTL